jgi:plasmid stabilization system protein ParE
MEVRWSPEAADDLAAIVEYIQKDDPAGAQRVAKDTYDRAGSLMNFPYRGRQGRLKGTRELPLPPLPFIIVYRVFAHAVEIVNIIHGAQCRP